MSKRSAAGECCGVLKAFEINVLNIIGKAPHEGKVRELFRLLWDSRLKGRGGLSPRELFERINRELSKFDELKPIIAAYAKVFDLYSDYDDSFTASPLSVLYRLSSLIEFLQKAAKRGERALVQDLQEEIEVLSKRFLQTYPACAEVISSLLNFPIPEISKVVRVASAVAPALPYNESLQKIEKMIEEAAKTRVSSVNFDQSMEKLDDIRLAIYCLADEEINRAPWGRAETAEQDAYIKRITEIHSQLFILDSLYEKKLHYYVVNDKRLWLKQLSPTLRGNSDDEKRKNFTKDFFAFINECIDLSFLPGNHPLNVKDNMYCIQVYSMFLDLVSRPLGQQLVLQLKQELSSRHQKIIILAGKNLSWHASASACETEERELIGKDTPYICIPDYSRDEICIGVGREKPLVAMLQADGVSLGHELIHALHYYQGLFKEFYLFEYVNTSFTELYITAIGAEEFETIEAGEPFNENALYAEHGLINGRASHKVALAVPRTIRDFAALRVDGDYSVPDAEKFSDWTRVAGMSALRFGGDLQGLVYFLEEVVKDRIGGEDWLKKFSVRENLKPMIFTQHNLEVALSCGNLRVANFLVQKGVDCARLSAEFLQKLWTDRATHPFFNYGAIHPSFADVDFSVAEKNIIVRQVALYGARQLIEKLPKKFSTPSISSSSVSDLLGKVARVFAVYSSGTFGVTMFRRHIPAAQMLNDALCNLSSSDDVKVLDVLKLIEKSYQDESKNPGFKARGAFSRAVSDAVQLIGDYCAVKVARSKDDFMSLSGSHFAYEASALKGDAELVRLARIGGAVA